MGFLRNYGIAVNTGRFQTTMLVEIHNHGPVTMLLDSRKYF
ncbi:MAG: D-aminoacyl-tRNA deacylase [Eubacteriales bacterium]